MTNLLAEHTRALRSIKDDNKQLVQNSLKMQNDMNKTIAESGALALQLDKTVARTKNFNPLPRQISSAPPRQVPELNFTIFGCVIRVVFDFEGVQHRAKAKDEAKRLLIAWSVVLNQLTAEDGSRI